MASIHGNPNGFLASSSTARRWKYDVFLSFMVETQRGFTSYLYHWLQKRDITAFMDEPGVAVEEAIAGSRLAIVVLSRNYGSTPLCLEELVKIFELMKDDRRILAVFYKTDDVRYENGSLEDAFAEIEKCGQYGWEKIQQWRAALRKVCSLAEWDTKDYKIELDLLEDIVKVVCRKVAAFLPSTEPSSAPRWRYDVFLSFRGTDTRKNFTSHLYSCLGQRGIKTFVDDSVLQAGDAFYSALLKAIEESRLAIVVLSPNYASSTWCLEELSKICQFREDEPRIILPVFYYVNPSDVRHQRGSFQDAFAKHERSMRYNQEKLQQWRDALRKVANLSGWDSRNYRYDSDLIKEIEEYVHSKLYPAGVSQIPESLNGKRKLTINKWKKTSDPVSGKINELGRGSFGAVSSNF